MTDKSMPDVLRSLPDKPSSADIRYLPIIPPDIDSLQRLQIGECTNIDHIIDRSIFDTLPDNHKQGIQHLNDLRNCLTVPTRLNEIKGIIQQISMSLKNTTAFVSWGADNNAQTTSEIYLIVRLESRPFNPNKINSARQDTFSILDPWTRRSNVDIENYIDRVKQILNDFDTNTLPPIPLPLTPPPE
jgi:hypothetical protein